MPPAVAPGAQVGRARAQVRRERRRNLGDLQLAQGRLDDHLAGELHAGALQVERRQDLPAEAAQAAVEVADRAGEEQAADEAQHRVAEVAVQEGHRAVLDAAAEAVAHDQVVAGPQALDEGFDVAEVVAAVGVAHDHVAAVGGFEAAHQRRPVALGGDVHDPRAEPAGDLLGAVGAAVVGDHDLADGARPLEPFLGHRDALPDRLLLVEARHHDRYLDVVWPVHRLGVGGAHQGRLRPNEST